MTKKNYLQDRFFVSKRTFTTKHVKIVKNSQNSGFFFALIVKFKVFPGNLATLIIKKIFIYNYYLFLKLLKQRWFKTGYYNKILKVTLKTT